MSTRLASESGSALTLTTSNVEELIAAAPVARSLPQLMDRVLLYLVDHATSFSDFVPINETDYPLFGVQNSDDLVVALRWLEKRGYLDAGGFEALLSPVGWERGIELRRTTPQGNRAFVAMWFSAETKDAYDKGIIPALTACGYEAVRVDRIEHNEKIDDLIIAEIKRASIVVADFTGQRGGVYFEAGLAMGRGTPLVRTVREDQINDVHFDTRQYNHITWTTPEELRDRLTNRIRATLPTFNFADAIDVS